MKQKKIIFLITNILLLTHTCFSQINADSIMQYQSQNQLNIIYDARSMLMDAFVKSNKQKVQELHQYLSENFDQDHYVTLFPMEEILLFAWTNDFENMLRYAKKLNSTDIAQMQTKITPISTNNFYKTLRTQVQKELKEIQDNLQVSSLTQEEKDFAVIYLHYYLITDDNYDTIVRQINTDTKKFTATYPKSEFLALFEDYELKPSNWGIGVGICLGYSAKTGELSKSFNKHDGAADIFVNVFYRNIILSMGFITLSSKAQENIAISDKVFLPKDTSLDINNVCVSLGYRFLENKRFFITPMAGIGTTWTRYGGKEKRKENPALKEFDYSYGLTANVGIMIDIRLGKVKRLPGQNFVYPSFMAIRLSYKFLCNTLKDNPNYYNSNLHLITLGMLLFGRTIK